MAKSSNSDVAAPMRSRFTRQTHTLKVVWKLLGTEFDAFQTFFKTTLLNGSRWFTMTLPNGGNGLSSQVVRFADGYEYSHEGAMCWTVSATLEFRDAPLWSESALDTYLAS